MKKPFKIIGIILLIVGFFVAAVIALVIFWIATVTDVTVSDDDKKMIVRAIDLIPYFDEFSPVEEFESFEKVRYIDQSVELNYEYESPREDEPYIVVTVTHERNKRDANSTYSIEWSFHRVGLNIFDRDIDLEENSSFYSVGDRSRFANIMYDGDSWGHLFVVQKGKSVYAFTIAGFVIEDPTIWGELFDDRISNLSAGT